MRTRHLIILALPVLLLMASCRQKAAEVHPQPRHETRPADSLVTDSFAYTVDDPHGNCEVYIDYPVSGPAQAVSAIRHFIVSQLLKDQTQGVGDDPALMVRTYCERSVSHFAKVLDQMKVKPSGRSDAPEEGLEIRCIHNTPRWVTYEVYHYSYLTGGAHGEYAQYGVTLRLSDGRRLQYQDILEPMNEHLYQYLRDGMRQYFEIGSDKDLESVCNVDLSLMPLPTHDPYLTPEGVRFHYSIYDVCPFDWGDPAFTVPYEKIRPYLKGTAWDLIY